MHLASREIKEVSGLRAKPAPETSKVTFDEDPHGYSE